MIHPYTATVPHVPPTTFVPDSAHVIADVELDESNVSG